MIGCALHGAIIAIERLALGNLYSFLMTANEDENFRLDKWLWNCRFYKTRTLASAAISGGKVHLNAERVKPGHRVRIGDRLTLSLQGALAEFEVLGLPARRGPAAQAQTNYH